MARESLHQNKRLHKVQHVQGEQLQRGNELEDVKSFSGILVRDMANNGCQCHTSCFSSPMSGRSVSIQLARLCTRFCNGHQAAIQSYTQVLHPVAVTRLEHSMLPAAFLPS